MGRFLFFTAFLLCATLSFAQLNLDEDPLSYLEESQKWPSVPQSPEVAAFEKYGNLPVNMYSGSAQVSIPIYVLQGHESSVPISLTYDTSGIKADQLATNVGLGWNLNFGGVISRQVLALPDEEFGSTYTKVWDTEVQTMWDDVFAGNIQYITGTWANVATYRNRAKNFYFDYVDNSIDYQADLFTVNVNGLSATFVVDYQSPVGDSYEVYCIDRPDLKIYRDTSGSAITGWRVVDTNGMTYVFEQAERTYQEISGPTGGTSVPLEYTREYINAWYLTKMISPNGLDVFEFDYNPGTKWADYFDYTKYSGVRTSKHLFGGLCTPGPVDGENETVGWNRQYMKQPYLEDITYNGTELFTATVGSRVDISSSTNRYTSFTVKDENGTTVLKVDLDNDQYFTDTPGATPDEDNARLKLEGISIYRDNASDAKNYEFEYETDIIPLRNTNNVDFWGYFNGNTGSGNLVPRNDDDFQPLLIGTIFPGVIRDPSLNDAKRGALKSITYPTGGKTTFYYEAHKGFDSSQGGYDEKTIDDTVGGLRLQKQTSDPNDGGPVITTYYYYNDIEAATSGVGTAVHGELTGGVYETSGIVQQTLGFFEKKQVEHPQTFCDTDGKSIRYFQYATNRAPQAPQKVTYGTVSEVTLEGTTFKGCTITEFYNVIYEGIDYTTPLRPWYNKDVTNGEIKNQKVYDKDFNLLQETLNEYSNTEYIYPKYTGFHMIPEINPVPGTETSGSGGCFMIRDSINVEYSFYINQQWGPHGCNGGGDLPSYSRVDPNKYKFSQFWKRLDRKISKSYDGAAVLVDTTNYEYHPNTSLPTHFLPITIKRNDSKNKENKVTLTYPPDQYQTGNSVIDTLVNRNQVGAHLEIKKYYDGTLTSTQKRHYFVTGQHSPTQAGGTYDIIRPEKVEASKGADALEDRFIYHSYDDYGNPQEVSQPDGTKSYYIWGYHGKLLIAEIKNKTGSIPAGVQTYIDAAVAASDADDSAADEDLLRDALEDLRDQSYFDNSQLVTFTYDPGIGVTSITDPRGYTMFYEYDQHNRLEKVFDADGNLVGENEYNYRVN